MPPKLPFAAVPILQIGGLWPFSILAWLQSLIKNLVSRTGMQSSLCVDWDEEMKGLAGFIDDHCIELLGEQLASQATTQRWCTL